MHRRLILQSACLLVAGSFVASPALHAAPLPPAERDATLAYIASVRNEDGGYRTTVAPGPSSLANTVPALRAYKHLGAPVPRPRRTLRFVLACHDVVSGGFGDSPGAKPDVRSTAVGIMALAELGQVKDAGAKAAAGAEKFLAEQAKGPADIYFAGAAREAAGLTTAVPNAWFDLFANMQKADDTYGEGPLDTATAIITIIRLGRAATFSHVKRLTDAQGQDGGFAPPKGPADLATTYRMMRVLYMLKLHPNRALLRQFISRCRNSDGGYGPTPGAPSAANTTYYATIVLDWAEQLGE